MWAGVRLVHPYARAYSRRAAADDVKASSPLIASAREGDREGRMVAMMRLVLALSGLAIVVVDPAEPERFVVATYTCVLLYSGYSGVLYFLAVGRFAHRRIGLRWSHWIDVACFTALIALSSSTRSIFFSGFLFSTLVAAVRRGFTSGVRILVASAVLFGSVAYLTSAREPFELDRFLIRPVYLLAMGYVICYWGGFQRTLLRRLALLKEVAALSNPRFGVDRTIANVLDRLRTFYGAAACVVLTTPPGSDQVVLRRSRSHEHDEVAGTTELPARAMAPLLALDEAASAVATLPAAGMRRRRSLKFDSDAVKTDQDKLFRAAEILDARTLLTVPWHQRGSGVGRLYVTFKHPRSFERSELEFVQQVVLQVMPVLDNVQLVDRLATEAAEAERLRIARDLHDSVVQPYIGVRMGLAAIREKLHGCQDVAGDVEHLDAMVALEIQELRAYLSGLKRSDRSADLVAGALRRFTDRFTEATGMVVKLIVPDGLHLGDRLAAETFQIVVEGLSNIRRHTDSSEATVRLWTHADELFVSIHDTDAPGPEPASFWPRSIAERVTALGGRLRVDKGIARGSTVNIAIPL
jgi:signal transduction histidine kinase